MNPPIIKTLFVIKAWRVKLGRVRQNVIPIKTAVNANIWPISTPTLKLKIFATNPFVVTVNSCSFVARPKP